MSLWNAQQYYSMNNTYSSIHPVLMGDNPDNSFSEVPYEKGYQLLMYIQSVIGKSAMQQFIGAYVQYYKETSINSFDQQRALAWALENSGEFTSTQINHILGEIDWNTWKYAVGTDPSGTLNFNTTNQAKAVALANAYVALNGTASPANFGQYNTWYSNLKVVFHDTL